MTNERMKTAGPFGGRLMAKMIDRMMSRCVERMMPRMQAMCGAAAGDHEADGGKEPQCAGCG